MQIANRGKAFARPFCGGCEIAMIGGERLPLPMKKLQACNRKGGSCESATRGVRSLPTPSFIPEVGELIVGEGAALSAKARSPGW